MLCRSRFNNSYNTHIFIQLQEPIGAGFVYPNFCEKYCIVTWLQYGRFPTFFSSGAYYSDVSNHKYAERFLGYWPSCVMGENYLTNPKLWNLSQTETEWYFNWTIKWFIINDIWNKSYMNCGNEMKMKKWSSQWTQCNLWNCVKKPENGGLNPWPRDYRCDALLTELWSHWHWEQVNCGFICSRERNEC